MVIIHIAGWTYNQILKGTTERDRQIALRKLSQQLETYLDKIKSSSHCWPFNPKTTSILDENYYQVIKNHIDLGIITNRLKSNNYYRTKEMMIADLLLMVSEFFDTLPLISEFD